MYSLGKLAVWQEEISVQSVRSVPVSVSAFVPEEQKVRCSSMLFLIDILPDRDFLVNSGVSVSVFPGLASTSSDRFRLLTTDGTPMHCSGTGIILLFFSCGSESKVYSWNFHLAPVSVSLLGADCLQHFDLLVDVKGRRLVHAQCPEDVVIHASPDPVPAYHPSSFLAPLSASRSCSPSFWTLSPWTDSLPPSLVMVSAIICSPTLVLQCMLSLGGWIWRS